MTAFARWSNDVVGRNMVLEYLLGAVFRDFVSDDNSLAVQNSGDDRLVWLDNKESGKPDLLRPWPALSITVDSIPNKRNDNLMC